MSKEIKEAVIGSIRNFVEEGYFVEDFVEKNCPWIEEEGVLVFPSTWLNKEDLEAVLEKFFDTVPVVSWDGYLFKFDNFCFREATSLVICKKEEERCLFIFSYEKIPVLNKVLEKEDSWSDR